MSMFTIVCDPASVLPLPTCCEWSVLISCDPFVTRDKLHYTLQTWDKEAAVMAQTYADECWGLRHNSAKGRYTRRFGHNPKFKFKFESKFHVRIEPMSPQVKSKLGMKSGKSKNYQ